MYQRTCKTENCGQPFETASPNGRYCPKCMEDRGKTVTTMFTAEQVQEMLAKQQAETASMLAQQQQMNLEMMKEFAKELRKPSEEEIAKKEAEAARLREQTRQRIEAHRIADEARARFVQACAANGHRNEKGRVVISGQPTTGNGMYQPMCVRCNTLFPPVPLTGDMLGTGGGLGFGDPTQQQAS